MGLDLAADLDLARRLGQLADSTALPYFRTGVRAHSKADGSPVTEADLAVEAALLAALARERPGDAVLSEEAGAIAGDGVSGRRWLLDPIDGTAWFVAGDPAWGAHVALEVDGEIVLGVITRPVEGQSWWAAEGSGAWSSASGRLGVSATSSLEAARVGGYVAASSTWRASVAAETTWIDTPSPVLELLEGRLDAVLSEGGCEWDHAPAGILVREAGGSFTDLHGGHRIDLRGGLYSNGQLDTALHGLRTARDESP